MIYYIETTYDGVCLFTNTIISEPVRTLIQGETSRHAPRSLFLLLRRNRK